MTRQSRFLAACVLAILLTGQLLAGCGRNPAKEASVEPEPSVAVSVATATMAVATPGSSPEKPEPGLSSSASKTGEPSAPVQAVPITVVPPTREALSAYPGVLRAMTLTREEILSLLGSEHEAYTNKPLAYTVYTWKGTGLTLEFDDLSNRLRLIRIGERTIFLDGSDYRNADLNGDGVAEGVCSFEVFSPAEAALTNTTAEPQMRRQGFVTVLDEQTGALVTETRVAPFGGYSRLEVLAAYGAMQETLVMLDSQSDWECDVLAFAGGQLVSMLPKDMLKLEEEARVSTDAAKPDHVFLEVGSAGLSFQCILPEKLSDALAAGQPFVHRFMVSRKPVVTDEGLSLRVRHSLQIQLGTAASLDGQSYGRFMGVGQVTQEYRYIGNGEWKLLSTGGGPKYAESAQGSNLFMEDMAVGQTYLFSTLYDIEETYGLDPSHYTDFDLIAGLRFSHEGVWFDVVNARVARLEATADCVLETAKGLRTGDSRGTALSLLGLPDVGYFEDRLWTYWFYRGFGGPDERTLSLDRLTVRFSGDKVERIVMEGYVPID